MNDSSSTAPPSPLVSRTRRYLLWYVGVIGAIFIFGVGFFSGYTTSIGRILGVEASPELAAIIGKQKVKQTGERLDFELFWDVWDKIRGRYLRRPVDEKTLYYGAMQGLVASLNDPYSSFFPPKAAEEFAQDLAGAFEGVGAEIAIKENQLTIVAPLDGSPAERAGLKPGDTVLGIDGVETFGMTLEEAVKRIRGPQGTTVKLTIVRSGEDTARELTVTRERIEIKSVVSRDFGEGLFVIRISHFNDQTLPNFDKIVRELKEKKVRGIVVDLRNNPGGFLNTALQVTSEWLPMGSPVLVERGSDGRERVYTALAPNRLVGVPTVVLVNRGSASGSEILAGALQDNLAATIVGEKTFGKGTVQDYDELPDGSGLKLTVAEWLTPNKNFIHEKGIEPNVIVEEPKATAASVGSGANSGGVAKAGPGGAAKPGQDFFLDRAVEVLKQMIKAKR